MNFLQLGYKGNNNVWLYILTMFLVFVGMQIASLPLIFAAYKTVGYDLDRFREGAEQNFMNIGMDANLYLFLMIFTFAFSILVLFLCVKYMHKKKFLSIITSRSTLDWKRVFFAFVLWGSISVIIIFIGIFMSPEDYTWNFKLVPFTILLLVSFLFLPFQTSAEEFVFRGYLMQGFAILAKNKWFPLLMTSIIFGLLHGMNPEVEKLGSIVMVFYIGTGLLFGITTLMDEGTELALGLHASNNIVAAFLVSTDWMVFQTDALYLDTSEPSAGFELFFSVLVLYPLLLVVFTKKYGWTNWKGKLFGKVEKPLIKETN